MARREYVFSWWMALPIKKMTLIQKISTKAIRGQFIKDGFRALMMPTREIYCSDCGHSSETHYTLKESWCGKCHGLNIRRERDEHGKMIPVRMELVYVRSPRHD